MFSKVTLSNLRFWVQFSEWASGGSFAYATTPEFFDSKCLDLRKSKNFYFVTKICFFFIDFDFSRKFLS